MSARKRELPKNRRSGKHKHGGEFKREVQGDRLAPAAVAERALHQRCTSRRERTWHRLQAHNEAINWQLHCALLKHRQCVGTAGSYGSSATRRWSDKLAAAAHPTNAKSRGRKSWQSHNDWQEVPVQQVLCLRATGECMQTAFPTTYSRQSGSGRAPRTVGG